MPEFDGIAIGTPLQGEGGATPKSKAAEVHRDYKALARAEELRWISYIGTAAAMVDEIIPYRREKEIRRKLFAYGVPWNTVLVDEKAGHIAGAPTRRDWGPLGSKSDKGIVGAPEGWPARDLYAEATMTGQSYETFWGEIVLRRMLATLGGLILVSMPTPPEGAEIRTLEDAARAGQRPFYSYIPLSDLLNWHYGDRGFTWIKVREESDAAGGTPDFQLDGEQRFDHNAVWYWLADDGVTWFRRTDFEDNVIDEPRPIGRFEAPDGRAILPLVHVRLGHHNVVPWAGTGILSGLDEIVLRAFNLNAEVHETFRNGTASAPLVYRGTDASHVVEQLDSLSEFLDIGQDPNALLNRLSGDPTEIAAGLELKNDLRRDWESKARANIEKLIREEATPMSGVAIEASHATSQRPLLVAAAKALDAAEEQALYIAAQMTGANPQDAFNVRVETDTTFRLEEEASRIGRIYNDAQDLIPPEAAARLGVQMLEAMGNFDMDEEVEVGGEKVSLRDVFLAQLRDKLRSDVTDSLMRSESIRQDTINAAVGQALKEVIGALGLESDLLDLDRRPDAGDGE